MNVKIEKNLKTQGKHSKLMGKTQNSRKELEIHIIGIFLCWSWEKGGQTAILFYFYCLPQEARLLPVAFNFFSGNRLRPKLELQWSNDIVEKLVTEKYLFAGLRNHNSSMQIFRIFY